MPKVHCLVPGSSGAFCIMAEQSFNVCCVGKCLKFISQLLLLLRDGRDFFQSLGLHMGGSHNLGDFIFIRLPKDGMDPRLKTKMCVRFCKSELYGPLKGLEKTWIVGAKEGGKHLVQGLVWMGGEQQNCGSVSQRAEKQMNRMNR